MNLWKDLLTKLGSPEELQSKLESMTADAFPKAPKRRNILSGALRPNAARQIEIGARLVGGGIGIAMALN